MRVKSCAATDGGGHLIQLSDEHGCVLRPKMISKFLKARSSDERASVITYAFFHAFKFPDALSVHINCKVEICRRGCLDHCQLPGQGGLGGGGGGGHLLLDNFNPFAHEYGPLERQDDGISSEENVQDRSPAKEREEDEEEAYDDDYANDEPSAVHFKEPTEIHYKEPSSANYKEPPTMNFETPSTSSSGSYKEKNKPSQPNLTTPPTTTNFHQNHPPVNYYDDESSEEDINRHENAKLEMPRPFEEPSTYSALHQPRPGHRDGQLPPQNNKPRFPHGPRNLDLPATFRGRKKRFVVNDKKARNADVGVSGLYDVISEADLAFTPDVKEEAVTIFQGRIREDIVYGICLPAPGFSLIFVLVSMATVISALVAGFLFYHYQLQKEVQEGAFIASVRNWMVLHILRSNPEDQPPNPEQQHG